ncbi:MAG: MFS transporter [Betaproteobacteria bacterium RIFCSPHIGHO2_12_FULL_69_13]|nr:MAG: MFS transporter [Betaproteobacteria bacterium RIFCSPHIGHO2_12_FULL_69_13]
MNVKIVAALAALVLVAGFAQGQEYPVRPIKIIQGFAPGGNADVTARILGGEMSKGLGQPILVEAKPGAGSTIAADAVAKSSPDGYTLLLVTGGNAVAGALYKSLPYHPVDSFQAISTATQLSFLFVVRADSALKSISELLGMARGKPGSVAYGSAGIGSTQNLTGELLASMAGVKLLHVPYKGDSGALTGLLGGEIPVIVVPPAVALGNLRSGKVGAIAGTGGTRWQALPDVPTVAESGVAGFDVRSWIGLAAAAGTPRPIVDRLNAEMQRTLRVPEVRAKLEQVGGEVIGSTPEQMRDRLATDVQRWTKVISEANIPRQ